MDEVDFFRGNRVFMDGDVRFNSLLSHDNLKLDNEAVHLFLKIGYVPGEGTLFQGIKCLQQGDKNVFLSEGLREDALSPSPYSIKRNLLEYIEKNIDLSTDQVVPLSGGMDSRIVLGLLLEFVEAKKIKTYTFGIPRSYDFDIPRKISKSVGTEHAIFSAAETNYDIDGLVRAAKESDGNTEIFHPLVLNRVADYYGENASYWSGFAGDIVGAGFSFGNSDDPFSQNLEYESRGIHYHEAGSNAVDLEIFKATATSGKKMGQHVPFSEAIFWENHMERYTAHHIFRNDMRVFAPLVSFPFVRYFLSCDDSLRVDKKLFNNVFSSMFPELFKFPTKDYGYRFSNKIYLQPSHLASFYYRALLWRILPSFVVHPNAAYLDMRHAINNRIDVFSCVNELITDLAKRGIVDSKRMFTFLKAHRDGSADYTKDIINLASLEVILKAAKL